MGLRSFPVRCWDPAGPQLTSPSCLVAKLRDCCMLNVGHFCGRAYGGVVAQQQDCLRHELKSLIFLHIDCFDLSLIPNDAAEGCRR